MRRTRPLWAFMCILYPLVTISLAVAGRPAPAQAACSAESCDAKWPGTPPNRSSTFPEIFS
jgi:hypothetical protein